MYYSTNENYKRYLCVLLLKSELYNSMKWMNKKKYIYINKEEKHKYNKHDLNKPLILKDKNRRHIV